MADQSDSAHDEPGRAKVLFVDDEHAVRRVGQRALTQAGFEVLVAENGRQALSLYQAHCSEIGLVVLDMSMPDLNGLQTFEQLKTLDADVRVVLSSGYDSTETQRQLQDLSPAGFIQKPYRISRLIDTVRELLGGP